MGEAFWCRHREAALGVCDRSEGVTRVTARKAVRETVDGAMFVLWPGNCKVEVSQGMRWRARSVGVEDLASADDDG